MSENASSASGEKPKQRPNRPLVTALVALLAAGGAFGTSYLGLFPLGRSQAHGEEDGGSNALAELGFVPIPPLVVSLGPAGDGRHLRFVAQIETSKSGTAEVEHVMPRIVDVINGYLRAVEIAQLEDPAALMRLRAQILRRVQMVTGPEQVRDLLITEFVLS